MSVFTRLQSFFFGPLNDLTREVTWLEDRVTHVILRNGFIRKVFAYLTLNTYRVWGDSSRLRLAPNAVVNDALFNTVSGCIVVEEYAFFGHNVSLITGTHDISKTGRERMWSAPRTGRDIRISRGVWIGSNSTIIGPCVIGENAVVAAGSVVTRDVEPNVVVAGVPAKLLKRLDTRLSSFP